jgi:thiol-disulfide isomerase/thioredoxin
MGKLVLALALAVAAWGGWTHLHAHAAHRPLGGPSIVDGSYIPISHFAPGRPYIINVYASFCSTCQAEAPFLRDFASSHPGQVLGIDTDEAAASGWAAAQRWGWTFPVVSDATGAILDRMHVKTLATTIFVNAAGHAVVSMEGDAGYPGSTLFASNWRAAGGT